MGFDESFYLKGGDLRVSWWKFCGEVIIFLREKIFKKNKYVTKLKKIQILAIPFLNPFIISFSSFHNSSHITLSLHLLLPRPLLQKPYRIVCKSHKFLLVVCVIANDSRLKKIKL